ncbi:DUF420 domain-containing protein [Flavobacterium sp. LHD-80]|uniref:DUF420 domain-containing protein n=1 Tax=unclassified Flavobacterium TaxID=196869 RepID=UPI0027E147D1|nr:MULTISPECIES: DUF420 domain-containing protein [unclassified Flavobacterium]MDQ6470594.1 DUF420 domain-containing protein [Flavobacterium sp. LHD-80]MDQ6532174.1 DUF420 domain-containing protein [Flavobacterium sp. LHD-85]
MNATIVIMTAVLLLTLFSPFGVYYGVKIAKKRNYQTHRRIQNITFIICVIGVLALEGLIRSAGGSGSLASQGNYYNTSFFKITLFSHIIIAVLSYLLWTILIVISNIKFQKSLPGKFSTVHKRLGYVIFGGLIYTAVTALAVYLMTLNLI